VSQKELAHCRQACYTSQPIQLRPWILTIRLGHPFTKMKTLALRPAVVCGVNRVFYEALELLLGLCV
jgi:hypothetical protein